MCRSRLARDSYIVPVPRLTLLSDQNRDRIVSQHTIPAIVKYFDHPSVAKVAVPVTFNICVDYGKLP